MSILANNVGLNLKAIAYRGNVAHVNHRAVYLLDGDIVQFRYGARSHIIKNVVLALADLRRREPAAGRDRPRARDNGPHQDGQGALPLGHAAAARMAAFRHDDGGMDEDIQRGPPPRASAGRDSRHGSHRRHQPRGSARDRQALPTDSLFKPLPGQEERNVRYLTERHAALRARTIAELTGMTGKILENAALRESMTTAMREIARPYAAADIAAALVGI